MRDANAKRCSRCGSGDVLPIRYGLPSREMFEDALEGRIVLGCSGMFVGSSPAYACDSCDCRWGLFTDDREIEFSEVRTEPRPMASCLR